MGEGGGGACTPLMFTHPDKTRRTSLPNIKHAVGGDYVFYMFYLSVITPSNSEWGGEQQQLQQSTANTRHSERTRIINPRFVHGDPLALHTFIMSIKLRLMD